ncbi:hypothetical protein ANN_14112 [Periplaneta americana]|uniref:Transposase n=1 Tax=Periplaneta americana TaxID=6978 RepID=A0ABQ8SVZ9_PERAM|nr:hypothetical protein ANN_14112 [Periplaneta americana]
MYGKADGNAALARLYEYGKFNSPGLGRGRPRSTTPEVQEEILEASISIRRVALQVNVPHTTVWRLLKEYHLYPYHLQRVQALSPADYPARVRFCQWFLQQCGVNPNFPALVLFTDEAQFTRDGITNFHNQHVWAYENPRATLPSHHQVRLSLNMWAGIIGDRFVGPHVLVNRLTGQAYTYFLENTIPQVLEDTPLINRQHIHFLHDGAPAHFSRTARRYLDRRFPDRWIGRGGLIAWPPRSPDLNPLDFYLWGHLKSLVYSSPVTDLESLRNRIMACSEYIRNTPGVWDRVRSPHLWSNGQRVWLRNQVARVRIPVGAMKNYVVSVKCVVSVKKYICRVSEVCCNYEWVLRQMKHGAYKDNGKTRRTRRKQGEQGEGKKNSDLPDPTAPSLSVTNEDVLKSLQSFPQGSAAGIDGLRPQHLKPSRPLAP